ncbi:MAG: hypothetical protein ACYC7D_05375 [Nitrososphaerales archaeon]
MTVDPLLAVQSVLQNASYESDDATPLLETYANNGFDVQVFPYSLKKQRVMPLITVGPMHATDVKPQNIGDSPNSRWLYKHYIECHLLTQTYSSPNISGYNGMIKLWEAIRAVLIQKQSSVDGSGNWLLLKLSSGPNQGPDTSVTPDRYDLAFVVELQRSAVN